MAHQGGAYPGFYCVKHLNIIEDDFKINVNAYLVMALRPFYAFVLSNTVLLLSNLPNP